MSRVLIGCPTQNFCGLGGLLVACLLVLPVLVAIGGATLIKAGCGV